MRSFVNRNVNSVNVMEGMLFDVQKRSRCIAGPTIKGSSAIC